MKTRKKKVTKPNTVGQYLGTTDPAEFIHSNKTHRSASEAFRDADYATAFWKCETEWDRTKPYLQGICMWIALIGSLYLLMSWFNSAVN